MKTASRTFIITGPESCGKTTLALQLSEQLKAPLVPEYSRNHLEQKLSANPGFRYQPEDLLHIARRQYAIEQEARAATSGDIVCDTDLLVILIWSEVKYGSCHAWIRQTLESQLCSGARHYFLCDWNIPWEQDPLRENPHDRHRLYSLYLRKLEQYRTPFTLISGPAETRLQQALSSIQNCST